jgi:diguanylate cyclase (GGDEF)-like protein/putative nucleotidyltransferase with HDIG domain
MSTKAKLFIGVVLVGGATILGMGAAHWNCADPFHFGAYLAIALVASVLKVSLPGITGTMSVNFLFILIGIVELSLPETLLLGSAAALVQYFWNAKGQTKWVQVLFNLCNMALAVSAAFWVYHASIQHLLKNYLLLALTAAAGVYFVANTVPIATVISLTESKTVRKVWSECYFWSFPYYLLGATLAAFISWVNVTVGWQSSLLVLPPVYLIYRSYHLYLGKLENEKEHVEQIAGLHLRTIEALALAIEAKDHTTHDHLQRVRIYATELAGKLDLSADNLQAVHAAALLHDIGKLAVPEHIISKPGRLSPEEFEKMKIHPLVGAEILERVQFPYPVVPIVQAHHEKWDGSGYPYGLKGEQIPIGARILAAVDCLDALASDRQYRRALPLDEAMERLQAESGTAFDPTIVQILKNHYKDWEKLARKNSRPHERMKLSTNVRVERGAAPATGFEQTAATVLINREESFLSSIAGARQEAQTLFELSQDLGNSLSLDDTLSVLAARLKRLVPYDSIAIYVRREGKLIPEHVSGDNFRLFGSLQIPLGEGLSGWVADNRKPIINGNPSVEPGYLNDPSKFSTLRSALAVPLEGLSGVVGVLTLYRSDKDAFTKDHLRVLLAISSKVAMSIENAVKYQQAESSATLDYLTQLPNARSLFLHLDHEVSRCKRTDSSVAVMVCDLDGFKQINDRFGHLEGNRLLHLFAQRLKETCREYDYVARMGGDEFVIVAPGLKPDNALQKVEVAIEIATRSGREVCGEDVISLSAGLAVYPDDGEDPEELLAEADRRMYVMKQQHHRQKDLEAADKARAAGTV